jgi:hypothetical protein
MLPSVCADLRRSARHALAGLALASILTGASPAGASPEAPHTGTKHALLIAFQRYQQWLDLPFAGNDIAVIAEALLASGFEEANIHIISDVPVRTLEEDIFHGPRDFHYRSLSSVPSRRSIRETVAELARSAQKADDTVLVYYSGHGVTIQPTDEPFITLPTSDPADADTMLAVGSISSILAKQAPDAHKLVIIDACAARQRTIADAHDEPSWAHKYQNLSVFFATGANQLSYFDKNQFKASVYTHFFAEAISQADFDKDGIISLSEIDQHLRAQVPRYVASQRELSPTDKPPPDVRPGQDPFSIIPRPSVFRWLRAALPLP